MANHNILWAWFVKCILDSKVHQRNSVPSSYMLQLPRSLCWIACKLSSRKRTSDSNNKGFVWLQIPCKFAMKNCPPGGKVVLKPIKLVFIFSRKIELSYKQKILVPRLFDGDDNNSTATTNSQLGWWISPACWKDELLLKHL